MIECDDCRYRLWPAWCHAAKTGSPRLCELIHRLGRADYAGLVDRLTTTPQPSPLVSPQRIPDRVVVAIETCDFRRSSCGCLSKPATCLQSSYPAVVGLADCLDCVAGV